MKLFVGVTNNDWYDFLAARKPEEVNFWRPRSQHQFRVLAPGELFLFKLHAPLNYIVGGGYFVSHRFLPLALAWQAFGERNGVPDYESFERRILEHRQQGELLLQIGCTILTQPFFWPRDEWIPVPESWSRNIVVGRAYSADTIEGERLFAEVGARLKGGSLPDLAADGNAPRYGKAATVLPRLGQGAFRVEVTDAYSRRCAMTGERTLPALEAAHIRPFSKQGPHEIRNGLLLRSDLHNLFDQGYLTVTLDFRVEVSRRIREEFQNGRHYYELHGQALVALPTEARHRPAREFLEWHHGNFKG
jgi:putative restriction endonuclease